MEYKILFWANLKRHKGGLIGIFILIITVSIALLAGLSLWINSGNYIQSELERAGFGTLTAWVSDVSDTEALVDDIENLRDVDRVDIQNLIYANYTINEKDADSEGQLITLESSDNRYKFFEDDLLGYREQTPDIGLGEVYVSPSLISMFGVQIGDKISVPIVRQGENVVLTIKGYYEDPFMGSSMIGMKGFLIGTETRDEIMDKLQNADINKLARDGAMLHIMTNENSQVTVEELSNILYDNTDLAAYTEFVHSENAIAGFMLILLNAFCGMLIAYVFVLLFVVIIVLGHNMNSAITADFVNMGILKAVGCTSKKLRQIQLMQYVFVMISGILGAIIPAITLNIFISRVILTTTGFLTPTALPGKVCFLSFAFLLLVLIWFVVLKTGKIKYITPLKAINGETLKDKILKDRTLKDRTLKDRTLKNRTLKDKTINFNSFKLFSISKSKLALSLAFRQFISGLSKYIGACMVAILLVFIASLTGRMDSWLGSDGKGMMDAFNPADHDMGVQIMGDLTLSEMEQTVNAYAKITDSYQLAMPSVIVNGLDYTANVITEPKRFHMLQGRTCSADNEIVLTEFVASDLGVSIGDRLTVAAEAGSQEYIVSGIYQCANDMGNNIGMSREGYLKISQDDSRIWCNHYFLDDSRQRQEISKALLDTYGSDVHVHENSWPGLYGIIAAMRIMVTFMYVLIVLFIMIVTIMTGSKILLSEQKDMAIYKIMGFSSVHLRLTFALRFGMTAVIGAIIGTIAAGLLTNPIVSTVMKLCGISNFTSNPTIASVLLPGGLVILLFTGFAYAAAVKIKKSDVTVLST